MTKKHFEAFAEYLRTNEGNMSSDQRLAAAKFVADVAKRFNPKFDENRFFRACAL